MRVTIIGPEVPTTEFFHSNDALYHAKMITELGHRNTSFIGDMNNYIKQGYFVQTYLSLSSLPNSLKILLNTPFNLPRLNAVSKTVKNV